jgi:hypothetical protein
MHILMWRMQRTAEAWHALHHTAHHTIQNQMSGHCAATATAAATGVKGGIYRFDPDTTPTQVFARFFGTANPYEALECGWPGGS